MRAQKAELPGMPTCRQCGSVEFAEPLSFGPQPICHHFSSDPGDWPLYPLTLSQCRRCALVQLTRGPDAAELRPRVSWLQYNEPERHLDALADWLVKGNLFPAPRSGVLGLTYKDDTLLRRLEERGWGAGGRLDPRLDLAIEDPNAGLETLGGALDGACGRRLAAARGKASVVVGRHLFEHLFSTEAFFACLDELLEPGGLLLLEVPDCERSLQLKDYTMIWEEHLAYFTPATFAEALSQQNYSLLHLHNYPLAMENSLVGVWRKGSADQSRSAIPVEEERKRFDAYREAFPDTRAAVREFARQCEPSLGLLGAGHLACTFLNLMELQHTVRAIYDDNPHKLGLCLPGVPQPIVPTSQLGKDGVKTCLLAVNPENEEGLLQKRQPFVEAGGRFVSIFPASSRWIGASCIAG